MDGFHTPLAGSYPEVGSFNLRMLHTADRRKEDSVLLKGGMGGMGTVKKEKEKVAKVAKKQQQRIADIEFVLGVARKRDGKEMNRLR